MRATPVERARAYILRGIAPAVSGSGGRGQLWRAAVAAVRFGLEEGDFLTAVEGWNAGCAPPWPERDLRRFHRDARKNARVRSGELLEADRPEFEGKAPRRASSGRRSAPAPAAAGKAGTGAAARVIPAAPPAPHPDDADDAGAADAAEDQEKARAREAWPPVRALTADEARRVAALRGVSLETVDMFHQYGAICAGAHMGQECWILTDGPLFRQARRLDGRPFETRDGPKKSLNLRGSQGRWYTPLHTDARHIYLTEGCVGALETREMLRRAEGQGGGRRNAAPVAAVSASVRLTPELLRDLRERAETVTILADNGPAGLAAAARWAGQIRAATGLRARCVRPPEPYADFGALLAAAPPEDPLWSRLFPPTFPPHGHMAFYFSLPNSHSPSPSPSHE